jgi:hypothetical protein
VSDDPADTAPTAVDRIDAAAAVVGTLIGGAQALAVASEGFVVDDGDGVRYPSEFDEDMFVGAHQQIWKNAISFESDLWWGDNLSCQVLASGYASGVNDELVCYPNSEHPSVPANRFISVNFAPSGDTLDHSLLTCTIRALGMEGDADNPYLSLQASGRFDPYGSGDTNYSFQFYVDMYGTISLGAMDPGDTEITEQGEYIRVYYH